MTQQAMGVDPTMLDESNELALTQTTEIDQLAALLADRLSSSLGVGDLARLLQFVPPIELKYKADAIAVEAAALQVVGREGVEAADVLLAKLGDVLDEIDDGFQEPTALAYDLHKRMTGLRADFKKAALAIRDTLASRLKAENRRLDEVSALALRAAQDAADKAARADVKQQVKDAAASGAPKEVLTELRQLAKTATAFPVASPVTPPTRTGTTDVEKWKARFVGTVGDPNPEMNVLSDAQQAQVCELMHACADRKQGTKLVYFTINWSAINKDAHAAKSTFRCPTLEAFDEGVTKRVPKRK